MAKAERQGWNTWTRFKKAGVVEQDLLFTDDEIIRDNALGRTQNTLGICWPIDAAVAYTLASHGPNAMLTWEDMVNQNTRIATVMMTGKVQWANVKNPHAESCGHDEVDCYQLSIEAPILNSRGHIEFDTMNNIDEWEYWDHMSDDMKAKCQFRVSKDWWHDNCLPSYGNLLWAPEYADVLAFIIEKMGTAKFDTDVWTQGLDGSHTIGECGWGPDHEKHGTCAHHDDALYEGWIMLRQGENTYETLWRRGKSTVVRSGTHRDPLRDTKGWNYASNISRSEVVVFDRVKRSLAQTVPDYEVINQIKQSIARMRKWDGRCLVEKTGRGRTAFHKWSDWDWLTEIAAWVQDTKSKNRHEGETQCRICYANGEVDDYGKSLCRCGEGWKYTKYDVKESYGHEIAKFEWRPMSSSNVRIYALKVSNAYLPWRFKTKEEAAQLREFFAVTATKIPGISLEDRVWDLSLGEEVVAMPGKQTGIAVVAMDVDLRMKWDRDPENLPTPRQALHMLQWGNPLEVKEAVELLKTATFERRSHHGYLRDFEFSDMKLVNGNENMAQEASQ